MDDHLTDMVERIGERHWGKYRGLVVDRDDPERLGRLRVRVPSLLADATTGWAWPVAAYAGAGIGLFALPQVGDVVWVEFIEGDLDHPVWAGGAWAQPDGQSEIPQDAQSDYPDRVVLQTVSGNVVVLSDVAGAERIVVRAASGCEVVIDPVADRITVQATEVVVRGAGGVTAELATKSFVQQVFDTHTHATGVGPSAAPVPPSNPTSLTTVLKAE
jgi:uncharacterized protein involved in type VI secretion and phage assembly